MAILILLVNSPIYSQDGTGMAAVTLGYTHNSVPSLSTGLAFGYVDSYYYHVAGVGGLVEGLIPLHKNKPWGIRAGAEAFFGTVFLIGLGARADVVYYGLNGESEWHFSPSIGWSMGVINFKYSYSAPFENSENIDISKHQFTTRITIPFYDTYRKFMFKKNKK